MKTTTIVNSKVFKKGVEGMIERFEGYGFKRRGRGSLPFLRLGGSIRFDASEIKRFLDERRNLKRCDMG